KDLADLNIKPAAEYPKTSEHIEDMVLLAEKLVNKGFAYEKLRSLYFDISRFSDYGRLSGIDLNKIKIGATVDLDEYEKDNPRDFTLFKRSRLSELKRGIYVKTDWGNVRPSWHIQCAAMSMKYLGEFFDIHTSSRALVFPHHENEIAIAQSLTGKPLAKYWMHCDQVLINDKNMGNKKNRLTLEELYDLGFSGREIRYWLFSSHYRKPINFSVERIEYAKHSLKRLDICINSLMNLKEEISYPELDQLIYDIKHGVITAMDDDLNISAALASIFNIIKQINILILKKMIGKDDASRIIDAFRNIDSVLGIFNFGDEFSNPEILRLIEERNKARAEKNWDLADNIREQLISLGVTVKDQKITI
ncbi:MAG: cysteine--tRNA ligase, partial [Deltaproteobacteria bacterium]